MIMSVSLGAALKLLMKERVTKNLDQLKKTFEFVNQRGFEGGLSSFSSFLDKFTNIDIALSPFKILIEDIKAATTESTMGLFKEVMELIKSDGAQTGAGIVKDFLNYFIDTQLTTSVTEFNKLLQNLTALSGSEAGQFLGKLSDYLFFLDDFLKGLNWIIEKLKEFWTWFTTAKTDIEDITEKLSGFVAKLKEVASFVGLITDTSLPNQITSQAELFATQQQQILEMLELMHAAQFRDQGNNQTPIGPYNPYDPTNGSTVL